PSPLPEPSKVRSTALANSPLPSARKSTLSAAHAFFQASMTNTSLTAVTTIVLTPLALMASAFCMIEGTCILWQVPGEAPGTGENAALFALQTSPLVFPPRPPRAHHRNLCFRQPNPTLIG